MAITYEADHFIEYLLISGTDMVRLSIQVDAIKPDSTKITWRMLFSANSTLAKFAFPLAFSEANYQKMMDDRQKQLNYYLKYHKMIGGK